MNYLKNFTQLKNQYFVIRHGKSKANLEEIILSHPDVGMKDYGLVEEGKKQVEQSITDAKNKHVLDAGTVIVSSDFTRARETAEIAKKILETNIIIFTPQLRERYFGDWEQKHNRHYQDVWDEDINNPNHKKNNVESTAEVLDRTTSLIKDLEERYLGRKILLVSHGDAL